MAILDDLKLILRVDGSDFDAEITGLIDDAKADLKLSGIVKIDESDPLIKMAIIVHCRAFFDENPDRGKYIAIYERRKERLMLAPEYTGVSR